MADEIRWGAKSNTPAQSTQHIDYNSNLYRAQSFIKSVSKTLSPGMNIALSADNNVLMFSFTPPTESSMSKSAYPLSLHQARTDFSNMLHPALNFHNALSKKCADLEKKRKEPTRVIETRMPYAVND